ncbi:two-component system regulatory protein YycI [Marinilactibacillus sp. Marseille-P9653]|uniref:two-component system regulatory protein YycI n=1 Tax=Marinilactibacillus sp. Marseille-P9653 TaxID=2866583 RepID=UPI001CE4ABA7|nr:two-component system regulatory protein YycI [Marinilactibacillus sp. Marseille-P9653]
MDFKKIENIFLLAFVFLNVYLLVSYINRTGMQYANSPSEQINIIREMREMGIQIPGNLSDDNLDVHYMQANSNSLIQDNVNSLENQAGSVTSDGTLYTSILSEPIEIEGDPSEGVTDQQLEKLQSFVNSPSILFGDQYAFLRYDNEENRFIFSQMVNGAPVGDGTSEISFYYGRSDGDIISYQQTYAGPMQQQGDSVEVISAKEAVEFLFQSNELSSNAVISQPILTYQRTLALEDLSIYGPVWLVPVTESSESRVLRVNAKDRTIISDPTESNDAIPEPVIDAEDEPDEEEDTEPDQD